MEFGGLLLAIAIAANVISADSAALSLPEGANAAVESTIQDEAVAETDDTEAETVAETDNTEGREAAEADEIETEKPDGESLFPDVSSSAQGFRKNIFSTLMNIGDAASYQNESGHNNSDEEPADTKTTEKPEEPEDTKPEEPEDTKPEEKTEEPADTKTTEKPDELADSKPEEKTEESADTKKEEKPEEPQMYLPDADELRKMLVGSTQYITIGENEYPVTISRKTLDEFEVLDLSLDERKGQLTAGTRFTVYDDIYEYVWEKQDTYDWNPGKACWELTESVDVDESVVVSEDYALDMDEEDFLQDLLASPIRLDNDYVTQTIELEEDSISSLEFEEPYVDYSTKTYYVDTYFVLDKDIVTLDVYASLGYQLKRNGWKLGDVEYEAEVLDADLGGVWSGSASDQQGSMDADLVISHDWTDEFKGSFFFGPSEEDPDHKPGSYLISGEIDGSTLQVDFKGDRWINRPDDYSDRWAYQGGTLLVDEKRIMGDSLDITLTDQDPDKYEDRFAVNTEFILPGSDQHLLSAEEYQNLSDADLQTAINELFARHGYIFNDASIAAYFESLSWYHGTTPGAQFDEGVFSDLEKKNLDALVAERERRK